MNEQEGGKCTCKQEVETTLSGWFWLGAVVSISSAVVDGAMGGMCQLPETVTL